MAGYNTGGAGYVFSRETLRIFKKALDEGGCPQGGGEDIFVANCLRSQGVKPVSTRDSSARETFFHFKIASQLIPGRPPYLSFSRNTAFLFLIKMDPNAAQITQILSIKSIQK